MRYMGGKQRLAKHIVPIIESYRKPNQVVLDVFAGSMNIACELSGTVIANDFDKHLILMYHELVNNNWYPPTTFTKEEYYYYKNNQKFLENTPLYAFVAWGCSFGGKKWGGWATDNANRDYAAQTHRALLKKCGQLKNVMFCNMDYRLIKPNDLLIYCDPPYANTTQNGYSGDFNSDEFWLTAEQWSKNNTVIVSEYNAPKDYKVIWEKETKTSLTQTFNENGKRVEKLFLVES